MKQKQEIIVRYLNTNGKLNLQYEEHYYLAYYRRAEFYRHLKKGCCFPPGTTTAIISNYQNSELTEIERIEKQ